MKSSLFVLVCTMFMVLGCSKDNNSTVPAISIKSFTDHVVAGGAFNAVLNYTQSGGNFTGDTLLILRHRFNAKPVPPDNQTSSDSVNTLMPNTPNTDKAEFSVSLSYENIHIDNGENDTISFSFILFDAKGKHSDTATTGKIVLLQ